MKKTALWPIIVNIRYMSGAGTSAEITTKQNDKFMNARIVQ